MSTTTDTAAAAPEAIILGVEYEWAPGRAPDVRLVPIGMVVESPLNHRQRFRRIPELADAIRDEGLEHELLGRPHPTEPGRIELVTGARRLRALGMLNAAACAAEQEPPWARIPMRLRAMTDAEVIVAQSGENFDREQPHPMEEAIIYERLTLPVDKGGQGWTIEHVALKTHHDTAHVTRVLQLLKLSPAWRDAFLDEHVMLGHALLAARIPTHPLQDGCLQRVFVRDRGELMTVSAMRDLVRREYMLPIASAKFDTTDAALVSTAGACSGCPFNTSSQGILFADVAADKDGALCTNPECWEEKCDAGWERMKAEAKKKGQRVLSDAEAKKIMPYFGEHLAGDAPYVNLAEVCYSAPGTKQRTWEQAVAAATKATQGELPPVTLVRAPKTGTIVQLIAKPDAEKLLRVLQKQHAEKTGKPAESSANQKWKEEQRKARREVALRASLGAAVVGAMLVACEKLSTAADIDRLLVMLCRTLVAGSWSQPLMSIAQRRGFAPEYERAPKNTKEMDEREAALHRKFEEQIGKLKRGGLAGLLLEFSLVRGSGITETDALDASAEVFGIKVKEVKAEAKKAFEAAEKAAAKKAPASKKKTSKKGAKGTKAAAKKTPAKKVKAAAAPAPDDEAEEDELEPEAEEEPEGDDDSGEQDEDGEETEETEEAEDAEDAAEPEDEEDYEGAEVRATAEGELRVGGPEKCPKPCVECDKDHHFVEVMSDFAEEHPNHPAAKVGCEAWLVCKHCPAWREYDADGNQDGEGDEADEDGTCDACGCVDNKGCDMGAERRCSWVDHTLCTACLELMEAAIDLVHEKPRTMQDLVDDLEEATSMPCATASRITDVIGYARDQRRIVVDDGDPRTALLRANDPELEEDADEPTPGAGLMRSPPPLPHFTLTDHREMMLRAAYGGPGTAATLAKRVGWKKNDAVALLEGMAPYGVVVLCDDAMWAITDKGRELVPPKDAPPSASAPEVIAEVKVERRKPKPDDDPDDDPPPPAGGVEPAPVAPSAGKDVCGVASSVPAPGEWVRLEHEQGHGPAHTVRDGSGLGSAVCGAVFSVTGWRYAAATTRDCINCQRQRENPATPGLRPEGYGVPPAEIDAVHVACAKPATRAAIVEATKLGAERVDYLLKLEHGRGQMAIHKSPDGVFSYWSVRNVVPKSAAIPVAAPEVAAPLTLTEAFAKTTADACINIGALLVSGGRLVSYLQTAFAEYEDAQIVNALRVLVLAKLITIRDDKGPAGEERGDVPLERWAHAWVKWSGGEDRIVEGKIRSHESEPKSKLWPAYKMAFNRDHTHVPVETMRRELAVHLRREWVKTLVLGAVKGAAPAEDEDACRVCKAEKAAPGRVICAVDNTLVEHLLSHIDLATKGRELTETQLVGKRPPGVTDQRVRWALAYMAERGIAKTNSRGGYVRARAEADEAPSPEDMASAMRFLRTILPGKSMLLSGLHLAAGEDSERVVRALVAQGVIAMFDDTVLRDGPLARNEAQLWAFIVEKLTACVDPPLSEQILRSVARHHFVNVVSIFTSDRFAECYPLVIAGMEDAGVLSCHGRATQHAGWSLAGTAPPAPPPPPPQKRTRAAKAETITVPAYETGPGMLARGPQSQAVGTLTKAPEAEPAPEPAKPIEEWRKNFGSSAGEKLVIARAQIGGHHSVLIAGADVASFAKVLSVQSTATGIYVAESSTEKAAAKKITDQGFEVVGPSITSLPRSRTFSRIIILRQLGMSVAMEAAQVVSAASLLSVPGGRLIAVLSSAACVHPAVEALRARHNGTISDGSPDFGDHRLLALYVEVASAPRPEAPAKKKAAPKAAKVKA